MKCVCFFVLITMLLFGCFKDALERSWQIKLLFIYFFHFVTPAPGPWRLEVQFNPFCHLCGLHSS